LISETRAKAQELASDISGFLVDGFVNAGQGGRSAFKNLADGAVGLFKRAAARIAATLLEQQFILPITTQIVGSAPGLFGVSGGGGGGILGSIFGSIFGGGGGGGATSSFAGDAAASSFFGGFTPVAKGGVFNAGNITPFARGGIVNRPTMFPLANGGTGLMGEAGAEAVVPLARDRLGRLGVRNDGGGGGDGTVVQIYDMRSAGNSEPVRTQERRGPDGRREIAVMIEEKIEDSVRSGRMDQPFAQTFGSRRVTKRV
jgi:hypothetical protein